MERLTAEQMTDLAIAAGQRIALLEVHRGNLAGLPAAAQWTEDVVTRLREAQAILEEEAHLHHTATTGNQDCRLCERDWESMVSRNYS